jgi:hypothetical protein
VTGFTKYIQLVTRGDSISLTDPHTLEINIAHAKSQSAMSSLVLARLLSSLGVARLLLLTVKVLVLQCSRPH